MIIPTLCVAAALILFILDAAGVPSRVNLQSAGLAFAAAAVIAILWK